MLDQETPSVDPSQGGGSMLLRLVWMAALPFILLCLFLIADQDRWTFGSRDVALAVLVVVAIAARAADVRWFGGTTADGDPATRSHVTGYAMGVVLLTIAGWLLAQSVAI